MFILEILVLLFIVVADLTSKAAVVNALEVENHVGRKIIEVIPKLFNFRYTENTGAGWSMLSGKTGLLIALTSVCMVAIVVYLCLNKKDHKLFRMSMVFILGGGVGNLIDRLAFGYVRDFIDFVPINFPIFNVADSFVTTGAVLMIIYVLFMASGDIKRREAEEKQQKLQAERAACEDDKKIDEAKNG